MPDPKKASKRPPNPKCGECKHPRSFHSAKAGARPCSAFGCSCEGYREEAE